MAAPDERLTRQRARSLRAACTAGGLLVVLGGMLGAVDGTFGLGQLVPMWSIVLTLAGCAVVMGAARAPRLSPISKLRTELLRAGLILALGAGAELLHFFDVGGSDAFHVLLAVALGALGTTLLITEADETTADARDVITDVRITGGLFLLAGVVRASLVAMGEAHAVVGGLSMILIAFAGIALARTARSSEPSTWSHL